MVVNWLARHATKWQKATFVRTPDEKVLLYIYSLLNVKCNEYGWQHYISCKNGRKTMIKCTRKGELHADKIQYFCKCTVLECPLVRFQSSVWQHSYFTLHFGCICAALESVKRFICKIMWEDPFWTFLEWCLKCETKGLLMHAPFDKNWKNPTRSGIIFTWFRSSRRAGYLWEGRNWTSF